MVLLLPTLNAALAIVHHWAMYRLTSQQSEFGLPSQLQSSANEQLEWKLEEAKVLSAEPVE